MSAVMVSVAVLIRTFSSGILAGSCNELSNITTYHPGLVMGDKKYVEYSPKENCRVND